MSKMDFDVEVWGFNVVFYNDVAEAIQDTGIDLSEISTFTYDDRSEIIIVIDKCEESVMPSQMNLKYIVHETNHAAMRMLDRVGVVFDVDNQEALCYTQDFIFSKVLESILTHEAV